MTNAVVKCTIELDAKAPKYIEQINAWFDDGVEVRITIPKHVDYKFSQFDEFTSGVLIRSMLNGVVQTAQLNMGLVTFYELKEGQEYDAVRTPVVLPVGVVLSKLITLQNYLPTTGEFDMTINHSIVQWFTRAAWGVSGHRVSLLINSMPVSSYPYEDLVTGWVEIANWAFTPAGHHETVFMSRHVNRLLQQLNINLVIDPLDPVLLQHLVPDEFLSNQELIIENFDWFLNQIQKEPLVTIQYQTSTQCVINLHNSKAQVPNVGAPQPRQYRVVYPITHAGKHVISQPQV